MLKLDDILSNLSISEDAMALAYIDAIVSHLGLGPNFTLEHFANIIWMKSLGIAEDLIYDIIEIELSRPSITIPSYSTTDTTELIAMPTASSATSSTFTVQISELYP